MVWESKGKKISYSSDQKHRDGNWGRGERPSNVQIIGLAERGKVIEEMFLELKKNLICRLKGYQIYSRVSGGSRGNTGLDTC